MKTLRLPNYLFSATSSLSLSHSYKSTQTWRNAIKINYWLAMDCSSFVLIIFSTNHEIHILYIRGILLKIILCSLFLFSFRSFLVSWCNLNLKASLRFSEYFFFSFTSVSFGNFHYVLVKIVLILCYFCTTLRIF